jgi:hypothetical protein
MIVIMKVRISFLLFATDSRTVPMTAVIVCRSTDVTTMTLIVGLEGLHV